MVKLIERADGREHLENCVCLEAKKKDARNCKHLKPDSRKKAKVGNIEFSLADVLHAGIAERITQVG